VIGVDTNVLIRLFVNDEPEQHAKANAFFGARTPDDAAFVSVATTMEFIWVLTRSYKRPQDEALGLLKIVLSSRDAVVEMADSVANAVETAFDTKGDFSDVIIAQAGRRAGCSHSVTFDRPAAERIPGMDLLA
jgi:predicted nucleic-acid-binding protein